MKYSLLIYANESQAPHYTPEEYKVVAQAWQGFTKEAEAAGVLLANSGLASANDATTVRVRDGTLLTTDGPFAETHEQLGGYILVDCQDIDEAMRWAAKIPTAQYGSIEIRPLSVYSQNGNGK